MSQLRQVLTLWFLLCVSGCAQVTGIGAYLLNPGVASSPGLSGTLHITSSPSPAKIYQSSRSGQLICIGETPFEILKAQLKTSKGLAYLTAEAPGYVTKVLSLSPQQSDSMHFDLTSFEDVLKTPLEKYLTAHPDTPTEIQQAMQGKKIRRGMTGEQVRFSWGDPDRVENSLWIYDSSHALFFENGKLANFVPNIKADYLYALYDKNEVAADQQYKDKIIVVTGFVRKVEKDLFDTPYVVLQGGEYKDVQCFVPSSLQVSKLAALNPGRRPNPPIDLKCSVRGKTLWMVVLDDCEPLW